MASLWDRTRAGIGGFLNSWLNADALREAGSTGNFDVYSFFETRKFRYDLMWAFYQNNAFADMAHSWAEGFKAQFQLYRNTRNIFCPAYRLGEFWTAHLLGGRLDPRAGDGSEDCSSLPIDTANEGIRPPIAQLWKHSNFMTNKTVLGRFGAVLGDVGLMGVDDAGAGRIKMKVIHPGHVKWLERDAEGNVTSYILEQTRYDPRHLPVKSLNPILDPRQTMRTVSYHEEAFVEAGEVVVRTYLNGAPFDWRTGTTDGETEWRLPFPFIPFRMVQHKSFGIDFGMSEYHSLVSKMLEVDDMASGLGDQVRKVIRAPKLITGIASIKELEASEGAKAAKDKAQDRNALVVLTTKNNDAKTHDLTFPLDIEGVGKQIERINREIEADYPEIRYELYKASGDLSGRALREIRRQTRTKVEERRVGYDQAIADVQKMCLAMGSIRGYEGYTGLPEDWRDRRLEHEIGHRDVFEPDPLDDIEKDSAFWSMVNQARKAGAPLTFILKKQGWSEADITELEGAIADEDKRQAELQAAMPQPMPMKAGMRKKGGNTGPGGGKGA